MEARYDKTILSKGHLIKMSAEPDVTGSLNSHRPDALAQGYIFDLDGTLYLGGELLPGAQRLIAALRQLDRKILFLTNNPTSSPAAYEEKLHRLGIPVSPDEILNTVHTMTAWLLQYHPTAKVFPISEQPLIDAITAAGIQISNDPTEIDIVIASYDRGFDYAKLQIAFDAIRTYGRAFLVTTNPDRFCPFPGGHGEPDAAAIVGAVEGCTGTKLRQNTGKPDPYMLETALDRLSLDASECVMIGDRLTTDIKMAVDADMSSALVLTGETTSEMLLEVPPADRPTWVLDRVDEILPPETWKQLGWN